jgi:hypothetical protein
MNENFFTRVPDALYDALRDGEITLLMFNIMLHLHRWANWETGIVQTVNAKRLRAAMGGHYGDEVAAERTIQRALQGLDEAGWIISGYVRGMKQPYGVQITNYQPIAGEDGEKALLIPMVTKHWTETKAFQGGDEGAEKALTQAVKRRLKELDCSQDCSNKTVHKTSRTIDQPTNQPTDQAADAAVPSDEIQNPEYESVPTNPCESDLALYFPKAPATETNLRMIRQIMERLNTETIWQNGIESPLTLDRLLSHNWSHFKDDGRKSGLRLRTLRQTHKAVVLGDPENGAIAQCVTHDPGSCNTCIKRAAAEKKREADLAKIDPMVREIPMVGFPGETMTKIVRKPRTKPERQLLLSWRYEPKKRWANIAPWLSQPNCPECHGSGKPCPCIVMEEML